jgi:hypothetical protein
LPNRFIPEEESMHRCSWGGSVALALLAALVLTAGGCYPAKNKVKEVARAEKKVHDHSGWWCDEHGIPEEECSLCSAKVAAEFKKKGDWCEEHDRAMSQCFLCDPKLKEKYAAKYRAKYGKEPPPIEEEERLKKEGKKS